MLGKPKFSYNEKVEFEFNGALYVGTVYVVDDFGTFEQSEEPSYDIIVDDWLGSGEKTLVKHVRESKCRKVN